MTPTTVSSLSACTLTPSASATTSKAMQTALNPRRHAAMMSTTLSRKETAPSLSENLESFTNQLMARQQHRTPSGVRGG